MGMRQLIVTAVLVEKRYRAEVARDDHDLHIRVLSTGAELLRELQLDPTKDYHRRPERERRPGTTWARCLETSPWCARGELNPHTLSGTGT